MGKFCSKFWEICEILSRASAASGHGSRKVRKFCLWIFGPKFGILQFMKSLNASQLASLAIFRFSKPGISRNFSIFRAGSFKADFRISVSAFSPRLEKDFRTSDRLFRNLKSVYPWNSVHFNINIFQFQLIRHRNISVLESLADVEITKLPH